MFLARVIGGIIDSAPELKIPDDHQILFEPRYADKTATDQRTNWRSYHWPVPSPCTTEPSGRTRAKFGSTRMFT